jgi:hypothetical protein
MCAFGQTAFSVDYGVSKDAPDDGDEGETIGVAAVQQVAGYGLQLYLGFRRYDLDEGDGPSREDIHVGAFGSRARF